MFKRLVPATGTPEFDECIRIAQTGSLAEVQTKANELGFKSDRTFLNAMRGYGYKREQPRHTTPVPELVVEDVSKKKLTAEVAHYKGLYKQAVDQLALHQTVEDVINQAASLVPPVVVKTVAATKHVLPRAKGSETDLLQVSDLHGGEVVRLDETLGINEYNMDIMNRRMGMMFRKALELVELRRGTLYIPKLIVAESGDMLSGDIHQELSRTNVTNMMMLAVRVAYIMSQGLAYLSPHFESIYVPCVVGNHPRLSKKPTYKEKYYNWDFLCYQWQAAFCKGLPNVTFEIPKAPYMLFNAEKTRIVMFHGDWIKSWSTIPYYGIERAILRLRETLQAHGDYFDAALMSHFHQRAEIPRATGPVIINGSVKGGDEYSLGSLQTSNFPSQNLLYFHSKNGFLGGGPIYLAEADSKPDLAFKDMLPDVWADLL